MIWHFPIFALVISLVFSATKFEDWSLILWHTVRWIWNIVSFIVGVQLVIFLLMQMWPWFYYIPLMLVLAYWLIRPDFSKWTKKTETKAKSKK